MSLQEFFQASQAIRQCSQAIDLMHRHILAKLMRIKEKLDCIECRIKQGALKNPLIKSH